MNGPKRIAVLASGRGSNFAALADGIQLGKITNAEIVGLICNRRTAGAIPLAEQRRIPCEVVASKDFKRDGQFDRTAHEETVRDVLEALRPDLICLAGYMLIVGRPLLSRWPNQILNIHPSLLPKFRGLRAQKQALDAGETETGCTVHFVNEELDAGPIILQKRIPILKEDTEATLSDRLLPIEHEAYVEAVQRLCNSNYIFENNRVVWG